MDEHTAEEVLANVRDALSLLGKCEHTLSEAAGSLLPKGGSKQKQQRHQKSGHSSQHRNTAPSSAPSSARTKLPVHQPRATASHSSDAKSQAATGDDSDRGHREQHGAKGHQPGPVSYAAAIKGAHSTKGDTQSNAPEVPSDVPAGVQIAPEDQQFFHALRKFAEDPNQRGMRFSPRLSSSERRRVHLLCALFGFGHRTIGLKPKSMEEEDPDHPSSAECVRCVKVWKIDKHFHREPSHDESVPAPLPEWESQMLKYYEQLVGFMTNKSSPKSMDFPPTLTSGQRKMIHAVAEHLELDHESFGNRGSDRFVRVTKIPPAVLRKRRRQAEILQQTLEAHHQMVVREMSMTDDDSLNDEIPTPTTCATRDGMLRYASWNIEWMAHYYASDTEFHKEVPAQGIKNVDGVLKRIAGVIRDLNPDVLAVLEGPQNCTRMQLFVDEYLGGDYNTLGGLEKGDQQSYLLIRRNGPFRDVEIFEEADQYLQQPWNFDIDGDCVLDEYSFVRRPLIVRGNVTLSQPDSDTLSQTRSLYVMALHAKSKYIHGGERLWKGSPEDKQAFIKKAVRNRRRITAECTRLRKCINQFIFEKELDPLVIVSGDINDGPGLDFFEQYYLLQDSVDSLLGSPFYHGKLLRAVLINSQFTSKVDRWTVTFHDFVDDIPDRKCLLDHIFVSRCMWSRVTAAQVAHDVFQKHASGKSRRRDERPSDHRPVFADFC